MTAGLTDIFKIYSHFHTFDILLFVEKLVLKHLLQALLITTAFLRTFSLDLATYIALKQLFQELPATYY